MELLLILFPFELWSEVIFSYRFYVNRVSNDLILFGGDPLLLLFEKALRLIDLPLILLNQLVSRLLRSICMWNQAYRLALRLPTLLLLLAYHGYSRRFVLGLRFGRWGAAGEAVVKDLELGGLFLLGLVFKG